MKALVYDTETTGLPDWHEPSDAPHQPHIVQLAAALIDLDTQKTIASMDVVVEPNGWSIPAEVAAIHGITTERAHEVGVRELTASLLFIDLWECADVRIAHNESFDARIVRIALKRMLPADQNLHDIWKAGKAYCTCKMATPILQLPPTDKMMRAGFGHKFKTANLQETYQHFFGAPFEGAHSAMADVTACARVYFAMTKGV